MSKDSYKVLNVISDPVDGLIKARVTLRETSDGAKFTFGLFRDYTKDGETQFTPWFLARHVEGIRRTLDAVENFIEAESKKYKAKKVVK